MTKLLLKSLIAPFLFSLPLPGLIFKEGLSPSFVAFLISFSGCLLFFYSLKNSHSWNRVKVLTIFLVGHYLMTFYWATLPIEEFKGIPSPWSHFMAIVFFVFNFSHYFLLILFFHLTRRYCHRFSEFELSVTASLLTALADTYFPQILPLQIGSIIALLPLSEKLLSLGGTPFITFLIMLFCLVTCIMKNFRLKLVTLASFFILIMTAGRYLDLHEKNKHIQSDVRKLPVVLVQPNIPNLQKIASEKGERQALRHMIQVLIQLSKNEKGILFWPETAISFAIPFTEISPGPEQNKLYEQILKIRPDLVSGAFLKDTGDDKATNSLFVWSNKKVQRYDKGMLKPFAEEFPIQFLSLNMKEWFGIEYELKRGVNQNVLDIHGVKFIGLICYESLKPSYIRDLLNNFKHDPPQFILNIANDGWFGNTSQPSLHFFMNRVRALEFSLPVIRVANTGVTGIIYPDSSKPVTLPRLVPSALTHELLILPREKSLYQEMGFLSTLIFSVFLLTVSRLIKFVYLLQSNY
jgi:apolipoprotein N-acyltransferase